MRLPPIPLRRRPASTVVSVTNLGGYVEYRGDPWIARVKTAVFAGGKHPAESSDNESSSSGGDDGSSDPSTAATAKYCEGQLKLGAAVDVDAFLTWLQLQKEGRGGQALPASPAFLAFSEQVPKVACETATSTVYREPARAH